MIEGKIGVIRIIEQVALGWKEVAIRLHFEGHDIQRIETDSNLYIEEACQTVFMEWLSGKGRMPITWETLIKALEEAGFSDLASALELNL